MKKDKQLENILKTIIILIDSREHLPNHLTETFDKYNIKWERKKLESGDYSAYIPKNEELNIAEDINIEKELAIERKMNLNEVGVNLTTNRERFKREFKRAKGKVILMIEDNTYKDIIDKQYNNKIEPNSFLGSLHGLNTEFDFPFIFIDKEASPIFIYKTFYYYLRNKIKYK